MKKLLLNLQKKRNAKINLLLILILLFSVGIACKWNFGDKVDSDDKKSERTKDDDSHIDSDKDDSDKDDDKPNPKADASKSEMPSDEELQEMVKADILRFDKALKGKDFTVFYENISDVWQKQTTPQDLEKSFQNLIEGKADLSEVKDLEAKFSPEPKIDDSKRIDVLEVDGTYDTKPRDSTFELKYIPDGKEWKLVSFFVKTTIYN